MLANDQFVGGYFQPAISTTPITIGNLQTVSISTHRDKIPVRALGKINVKGFTRGPRTIAGSLIFTMFDRESLSEVSGLVRQYYQSQNIRYSSQSGNAAMPNLIAKLLVDELPPFDITITMVNDYGQASIGRIVGVEIVTNGVVTGIDDLYLEEQMSYIALDYYPPVPASPRIISSPLSRLS